MGISAGARMSGNCSPALMEARGMVIFVGDMDMDMDISMDVLISRRQNNGRSRPECAYFYLLILD